MAISLYVWHKDVASPTWVILGAPKIPTQGGSLASVPGIILFPVFCLTGFCLSKTSLTNFLSTASRQPGERNTRAGHLGAKAALSFPLPQVCGYAFTCEPMP
jgi:hypothetical protein